MFKRMSEDIEAVKERDPAAPSTFIILLCYAGLQATWAHRVEHFLWNHHFKGLARVLSQITRHITGVEIHPAATIGRRFFIDHGMGVIVGETSIVGDDVTLFQGVTLGGTGKETGKRHPNIEDGVVVGVGACVLGNITVGARSKVGGGAVVVEDVPPDCTVVGVPGHIVAQDGRRVSPADPCHEDLPDPVVDSIERLTERIEQLERALSDEDS